MWGDNEFGQIGDGTNIDKLIPTKINHPISSRYWKKSFLGRDHTIVIDSENELWGWGHNGTGQLGLGEIAGPNIPTKIDHPTGGTWKDVAIGHYHTMLIDQNDKLWGCGNNTAGQFGMGMYTTHYLYIPTEIPTRSVGIKNVFLSNQGTWILYEDNKLFASGYNANAALGLIGSGPYYTFTEVIHPTGLNWVYAHHGYLSSSLKDSNADFYVVGLNKYGQLGLGNNLNDYKYILTKLDHPDSESWKDIKNADTNVAFGIDSKGNLYGWGTNGTRGDLGNNNDHDTYLPEMNPYINNSNDFNLLNSELDRNTIFYKYHIKDDNIFTWQTTLGTIDYYEISKDNGDTWENIGNNTSYTWDSLSLGKHVFIVKAISIYGTVNKISWVFEKI
jgi:alpha-tubulin suppressor-like RCC1 family protein